MVTAASIGFFLQIHNIEIRGAFLAGAPLHTLFMLIELVIE